MDPVLNNAPLSEGEIHYLWWFIQGSIMNPATRWRLRYAWGLCERHAWGFLQVDAAFRHGWLHGPAILYLDLMERALAALNGEGPLLRYRWARNLSPKGPCLMCEMGYGPDSIGMAKPEVVRKGRDSFELKRFTSATERHWRKAVCGRCAGDGSAPRCRPHLLEDLRSSNEKDLLQHRNFVQKIRNHMAVYAKSFSFGHHGTETEEDRAALVIAVGWCSGWELFLRMTDKCC